MDWKAFFDSALVFVLGILAWVYGKKGWKGEGDTKAVPALPAAVGTVVTTTIADDADILALKHLTGEVSGLAYAETEQAEAAKQMTAAIREQTVAAKEIRDDICEGLRDLTEQVRELRQELSHDRRGR